MVQLKIFHLVSGWIGCTRFGHFGIEEREIEVLNMVHDAK